MRPSSPIALAKVDGGPSPYKVRTNSVALTVPSFNDPATRSRSSQFSLISSRSIVCRARPLRIP